MALIRCSECGREISDKAAVCPGCGCPQESREQLRARVNADYKQLWDEIDDILMPGEEERFVSTVELYRRWEDFSARLKEGKSEDYLKIFDEIHRDAELPAYMTQTHEERVRADEEFLAEMEGHSRTLAILQVEREKALANYAAAVSELEASRANLAAATPVASDSAVTCPRCHAQNAYHSSEKGFGIGSAMVGVALYGPLGLAAGLPNRKKVEITCLKCGYKWAP